MKKIVLLVCFVSLGFIIKAQTFYMCLGNYSSSATSGNIYDSGGPSNNYSPSESCTFLIKGTGCNPKIKLTFSSFDLESGYDYLTVYNGSTTASPVLGNYTGFSIPPTVTATSGYMLLEFNSDNIINMLGFGASWVTTTGTCSPLANFNTNVYSCQGQANFINTSLNSPTTFNWDFGDGSTSALQSPSHTYTVAGTFNVKLTVANNYGNNSIIKSVSVNPLNFTMGYFNNEVLMNAPVNFTNSYTNAQYYIWDFGDASPTASTKYVQHTYNALGTYSVTLEVADLGCTTTRTLVLNINDILNINNQMQSTKNLSVFPNPTSSAITLIFNSEYNEEVDIIVYNMLGIITRQYKNIKMNQGENRFSIDNLQSGMNNLKVNTAKGSFNYKVLCMEN